MKVKKEGPVISGHPEMGPCWLWIAAKNNTGYGWFGSHIKAPDEKAQSIGAHVWSWSIASGALPPKGMEVEHTCHTLDLTCLGRTGGYCHHRLCVNPSHLELLTRRENAYRSDSPLSIHARKTHCPQGHPYSEENTKLEPTTSGFRRKCVICRRVKSQKAAAKRKEQRHEIKRLKELEIGNDRYPAGN